MTVRLDSGAGKEVEACGLGCRRQKPSQSCWPSSLNWEAAEEWLGNDRVGPFFPEVGCWIEQPVSGLCAPLASLGTELFQSLEWESPFLLGDENCFRD